MSRNSKNQIFAVGLDEALNSEQLKEILVPIPPIEHQNEIVEADIVRSTTRAIIVASNILKASSSDVRAIELAEGVISQSEQYLSSIGTRRSISDFVPNKRLRQDA